MEQLKMVEQPDELDEQESPEDINYLSNINRDVDEETRAQQSNLEKDAVEPKLHQTEKSNEKKPGTADEEEIRQTEEIESQENQKALPTTPKQEEQRPSTQQPDQKRPLLAMRELEQRDHKLPQTSHEALASEADNGTLERTRKAQAGSEAQKSQAYVEGQDKAYLSRLNQKQLETLYGKDNVEKKRHESKKQSKTKGVWDDQRKHWQSPLENMVPEVQPGNQTALRSRKHPFARYIAQMHRKIHERWAWNFLDQLDARSRKHPLNDYELWSRVEIVINGDGTIEKVTTVRHSGKTPFDAAAREIVWASGPFPDPPPEIISGNGKIYVHWAFHRDERACGTFGAQPFILDSSGHGDRPSPDKVVVPTRGVREPTRRLTRKAPAPKVAEGPAPPPSPPSSSEHDHDHDHDHSHGDGGGSGESGGGESGKAELTPDQHELAGDPKAKKVANEWLYYFSKGQIDKTVSRSSLPFYAGDSPVARTRAELHDLLATMSEESRAAGKPKAAKVYTAAGLRKVFGSVPAGVQEGGRRVYGLTKIGSEYVVLLLEKKFGSWRVVGVAR
jgi:TonB family protein